MRSLCTSSFAQRLHILHGLLKHFFPYYFCYYLRLARFFMIRYLCTVFCVVQVLPAISYAKRKEDSDQEMAHYRERIKAMFYHAYNNYLENAFPYDELRPLTCDGQDTWGSFSLTLIDALDTLLILGNHTEFQRVASLLQDTIDFDIDVNASVFETNIRVVGGLLSAHLLSKRAGMEVEMGWPCSGPLLRMAEEAARKLLPAFQTPTGMPYGTVNLLMGVSPSETPVTCTAGVGTFILEFAALSRLTGDPVFETVARRALLSLWKTRSDIGLVGNHIDVITSKWVAQDAGIGAGVDSYFEYLVKGSVMLQDEELLSMFLEYNKSIKNYTKFDDWYLWVEMHKGTVSMPVFQSLEAFWPGLQSLLGDLDSAMRTFHNYYSVWRQFGGLPEFYSIPQGYTVDKREGYPLRPELIESAMYLYRATGDPAVLQLGRDAVESIERVSRVSCGFASVKDVRDHKLDNRMESFFLAETVKYLYLLFDPDNFLHNGGLDFETGTGPQSDCVLGAGGYVYNTEAHPLDPAALHCCSQAQGERRELQDILLSLSESLHQPPPAQPEESTGDTPTNFPESIAIKPGSRRKVPLLSCPMQPFSSRLSILGQVFSDST
ncbi:ER degradation-enhancing alpha-mannosidase-like protein 2 [Brienomyrus brachyistius]|uniref:ER degradation-enhancing alpha-mannosidase-like protein 2 n=1 Tax=Brienomyrus brachyistius TaxID=42636 RepID=UPI0020B27E50|nr:ER degradation-enhancing alpha-mannosidase-like protein 2 [Brienomyrus brachyistius]